MNSSKKKGLEVLLILIEIVLKYFLQFLCFQSTVHLIFS